MRCCARAPLRRLSKAWRAHVAGVVARSHCIRPQGMIPIHGLLWYHQPHCAAVAFSRGPVDCTVSWADGFPEGARRDVAWRQSWWAVAVAAGARPRHHGVQNLSEVLPSTGTLQPWPARPMTGPCLPLEVPAAQRTATAVDEPPAATGAAPARPSWQIRPTHEQQLRGAPDPAIGGPRPHLRGAEFFEETRPESPSWEA